MNRFLKTIGLLLCGGLFTATGWAANKWVWTGAGGDGSWMTKGNWADEAGTPRTDAGWPYKSGSTTPYVPVEIKGTVDAPISVTTTSDSLDGWDFNVTLEYATLTIEAIGKFQGHGVNNKGFTLLNNSTAILNTNSFGHLEFANTTIGDNCVLRFAKGVTTIGNEWEFNVDFKSTGQMQLGDSWSPTKTGSASFILAISAPTKGKRIVTRDLLTWPATKSCALTLNAKDVVASLEDVAWDNDVVVKQSTITQDGLNSLSVGNYALTKVAATDTTEGAWRVTYVDYDPEAEQVYTYARELFEDTTWSLENAWGEGVVAPNEGAYVKLQTGETPVGIEMNTSAKVDVFITEGDGKLTISKTASNNLTATTTTINTDTTVEAGAASLGAVTIADGETLTVKDNATVDAIAGGTLVVDATAGDIAFTANTDLEIGEIRAYTGKVHVKGSGENGGVLGFPDGSNTLQPYFTFDGGTHLMKMGVATQNKLFGQAGGDEAPAITVTNGATLTFATHDLSGWRSMTNSERVVLLVDEGAKIIFTPYDQTKANDGNNDQTSYFNNRLILKNNATVDVAVAGNSWDNPCFRLNGGVRSESTAQIAMLGGETATSAVVKGETIFLATDVTAGASVAVGRNATLTIENQITGAQSFTKYGAGILKLTAQNTATGTLNVTAGELNLPGKWSGTVSIASGATLAGAGTVNGTLTFNVGATIDATDSAITASAVTLPSALRITVKTLPEEGESIKILTTNYEGAEERITDTLITVNDIAQEYYLVKATGGFFVKKYSNTKVLDFSSTLPVVIDEDLAGKEIVLTNSDVGTRGYPEAVKAKSNEIAFPSVEGATWSVTDTPDADGYYTYALLPTGQDATLPVSSKLVSFEESVGNSTGITFGGMTDMTWGQGLPLNGRAGQIDDTNGRPHTSGNHNFDSDTKGWTLSLFVKPSTCANNGILWAIGTSGGYHALIWKKEGDAEVGAFAFNHNTSPLLSTPSTLKKDVWHLVTLTYDKVEKRLYLKVDDLPEIGTERLASDITLGNTQLQIGSIHGGKGSWSDGDGAWIDEFAYWNTALTPSQIESRWSPFEKMYYLTSEVDQSLTAESVLTKVGSGEAKTFAALTADEVAGFSIKSDKTVSLPIAADAASAIVIVDGTLAVVATNEPTYSGAISGTGKFTLSSGTLALVKATTYMGATTIAQDAKLKISGADIFAANGAPTAAITVNGELYIDGNSTSFYRVVKGDGKITIPAEKTLALGAPWTYKDNPAGLYGFTGELEIAGTFDARSWSGSDTTYALTGFDVVLDSGTIVRTKGDGKPDNLAPATLTIANGKTLSGPGTVNIPLSLEDGATIDATAGAVNVADVIYNGAITVKVSDSNKKVLGTTTSVPTSYVIKQKQGEGETELTTFMLKAGDGGICAVEPTVEPIITVDGANVAVADSNLTAIKAAAAAQKVDVTSVEGAVLATDSEGNPVKRVEVAGLELFNDVPVTVDAGGVATVAYAFGIEDITVATIEGEQRIVVTAKVDKIPVPTQEGDEGNEVETIDETPAEAEKPTFANGVIVKLYNGETKIGEAQVAEGAQTVTIESGALENILNPPTQQDEEGPATPAPTSQTLQLTIKAEKVQNN